MAIPYVAHLRHTILVVDDDVQSLRILREILSRDGFDVFTAADASEALEMLRKSVPCMILLDVEMPGINGFELCRRIKLDPRLAYVPITLVTARVADSDVKEGIAAGAADYIKKPFDRDEIRMRVRTQIRLHEALIEQQRLHRHLTAISAVAKDAIVIVDDEAKIMHWNQAAEKIFGYSSREALGQNLHTLLSPGRFHTAQNEAFPHFQATGEGSAIGRTLELSALRKSGEEFPVELSLASTRIDDRWCAVGIVRDVTERKRGEKALRESEEKFRNLFQNSRDALMVLDLETSLFTSGNQAALAMFGIKTEDQFKTYGPPDLSPEKQPDGRVSDIVAQEWMEKAMQQGSAYFEWMHRRLSGEEFPATVLLNRLEQGGKLLLQATVRDISTKKQIEAELAHARKLEAVGQLAAGIAHEINTPAQYIGDSIYFLKGSFGDYRRLAARYRRIIEALEKVGECQTLVREVREMEKEVDLPYIEANVPESFDRCLDGIARISDIVRAMKEFAHPDQSEQAAADLNQALLNTTVIAHNEYKYVADLETELDDLPAVFCYIGDLNQVFLNLIVNASHAITDMVGQTGVKGRIHIRTRRESDFVRIDFADTGSGIPESIRHRIFEPFFTTKEVGRGSGQGLAIARSIIVEKHGGSLTFESEIGKGTTFTILLPIAGKAYTKKER